MYSENLSIILHNIQEYCIWFFKLFTFQFDFLLIPKITDSRKEFTPKLQVNDNILIEMLHFIL